MAHEDTCIQFEIGGRKYEAIGFLKENEKYLEYHEMIRRVRIAGNTVTVKEDSEDFEYLAGHLQELPPELQPYRLVVDVFPHLWYWAQGFKYESYRRQQEGQWYQQGKMTFRRYYNDELVLCRRS